ncbi:MAG: hypothetical protein V3T08_10075 [Gemmatimonadota bacterium]
MDHILDEIRLEREAQDRKFGPQIGKDLGRWHAILSEEYGEVAKEVCDILHGRGSPKNLRVELIQTAAVAVAMIEHGDQEGWWPEGAGNML